MCHEAGQSAFLHTQLYLSKNLDHTILGTNGLNSADVPLSNKQLNILFSLATFLGTKSLSVQLINQSINQSIHTVIRIHLISFSYHNLVILPSHFCSMEQMLMLMLIKLLLLIQN